MRAMADRQRSNRHASFVTGARAVSKSLLKHDTILLMAESSTRRVEPATGPGEIDDARDEGRVLVVAALRAFPETVHIMRDRRVS